MCTGSADVCGPYELMTVFHARHSSQGFPWQHLVAGAAGGAISRTATAPLELLRLRAMTGGGASAGAGGAAVARKRPGLLQALKAATGDTGWTGLWKGNGLNVLRAGPQKAIDFFSFTLYKASILTIDILTSITCSPNSSL